MPSPATVAAGFTALLAVAVAIWDNVETRKHNRLSVMPHIVLEHVRSDSAGLTRAEVLNVGPPAAASPPASTPW